MRTRASLKNISSGLFFQIINTVLSFIGRSVFVSLLGSYYLGVNSVLLNVINLLSFAELGIGGAITYSLYEPLAKNEYKKISALMNFYKVAYRNISITVFILGSLFFPFLKYFIDDYSAEVNVIFFIFLLNNILSYFLVYKKSILLANQKAYIINKISGELKIILSLLQILILVLTKSYYLYLFCQLLMTFLENIYVSRKVDVMYPYLKINYSEKLDNQETKQVISYTFSMFVYKISGIVINSTDSLIISYFIGSTILGIYSNYTLLFGTVITFLSIIFNSLTPSIGNLIISEDEEVKYKIYKTIGMINFWFYGLSSICFMNLTESFLNIWLGKEFLLSKAVLVALTINFYTTGMQNSNTIFREAGGLFTISKYKPLVAAGINIASSLILVILIGLPGVILGTVISRLCTYFWHDPYIIHKYLFNKKVRLYFIDYFKYLLILILTNYLVNITFLFIKGTCSELQLFVIKLLICLVVGNIIFILCLFKKEEFKFLNQKFLQTISSKLNFRIK